MYKVFCRKCWKANKDWPQGYEPHAEPMDKCRVIYTTHDRKDAISFCDAHNDKWRKYRTKVLLGTATKKQISTYHESLRYEFYKE